MLFTHEQLYKDSDSEVEDDINITTMLLYFDTKQLDRFKKLARAGIMKEFGQELSSKGNLTNFLMKIMEERYGKNI